MNKNNKFMIVLLPPHCHYLTVKSHTVFPDLFLEDWHNSTVIMKINFPDTVTDVHFRTVSRMTFHLRHHWQYFSENRKHNYFDSHIWTLFCSLSTVILITVILAVINATLEQFYLIQQSMETTGSIHSKISFQGIDE